MTLACGSDRDKKHLLILSFNVALESYTVLKAVLLPASSAHEAYSDSETLRLQAGVSGTVTDVGVLKVLEVKLLPFADALMATFRQAQLVSAKSSYAIQLLLHSSGTNTGSVGSSSGPSRSGTMSSSSSLRLLCSSLAIDKAERQLSIFFDEPEPDHVKMIDWVLRQKCMVLHRFIFSKFPSLPAGEATIRLNECRPLLLEYWWDVMMADQVDVSEIQMPLSFPRRL